MNSPFENNISFNYSSLSQIILDTNLLIVDINSSALKLFKYERSEMIGQIISNYTYKTSFSLEVDKMNSLLKREISNYIISRDYVDKFSKLLKIEINVSLLKDPKTNKNYYLGVFYPQEEKPPSNNNNNKFKVEDLKDILKKSPILQWVKNYQNNEILYENRNILDYLGYTEEDLKGTTHRDLFYLKLIDKDSYLKKVNKGLTFGSNIVYYDIYNKKNELMSFVSEAFILNKDVNGNVTLVYGIIQDITERKKNEQKINLQEEELDKHNKQLEEQLQKIVELESFASIASHDLKEPIRTIRNYTQILTLTNSDNFNSDGKELIGLIKNSTERMYERIEAILNFSKIATSVIEFKNIRIKKLIGNVLSDLDDTIRKKQSQISLDINSSYIICGEKNQLRQLFQNLISNAIKFSETENSKIEISLKNNEKFWLFSIQDNGIGIPEDEISNIFKIFKKLHQEKRYGGQGIGLSICKRIVERHQGKIWVESQVGKGSTFFFTIYKNC